MIAADARKVTRHVAFATYSIGISIWRRHDIGVAQCRCPPTYQRTLLDLRQHRNLSGRGKFDGLKNVACPVTMQKRTETVIADTHS